jgi:hypothetical protein
MTRAYDGYVDEAMLLPNHFSTQLGERGTSSSNPMGWVMPG